MKTTKLSTLDSTLPSDEILHQRCTHSSFPLDPGLYAQGSAADQRPHWTPEHRKTNIIDALTLLAIPELTNRTDTDIKHVLRAQTPEELFFIKGTTQYANVTSTRSECLLQYSEADGLTAQLAFDTIRGELMYNFDTSFQPTSSNGAFVDTVIKRYRYLVHIAYGRIGGKELGVPYGHNLFTLLEENPGIQKQIAKIFAGTGIQVRFDKDGPKIRIPNHATRSTTELHFASLSASLQRLCFYLAAIESNREKLILFDNMDAGIFPTFLVHPAARMLENTSNQYFFSTHAYYMLIDLLEDGLEQVAIFNVYSVNGETNVHRLTEDDLGDILYNGFDPFVNNEHFLPR